MPRAYPPPALLEVVPNHIIQTYGFTASNMDLGLEGGLSAMATAQRAHHALATIVSELLYHLHRLCASCAIHIYFVVILFEVTVQPG